MGSPAAGWLQAAVRVPPRRDLLAFLGNPAAAQERHVQVCDQGAGHVGGARSHAGVEAAQRARIERHDPDDPGGDFKRPLGKKLQRYEWSVRGAGDQARLRLTIGGGLAVTYRRR